MRSGLVAGSTSQIISNRPSVMATEGRRAPQKGRSHSFRRACRPGAQKEGSFGPSQQSSRTRASGLGMSSGYGGSHMTRNVRILVAEMIGTFVLMLGGPGTAVLATG